MWNVDVLSRNIGLYFVKELEHGIPIAFAHRDPVFSDEQDISFKTIDQMDIHHIAAVDPAKRINGKMVLYFPQNHGIDKTV